MTRSVCAIVVPKIKSIASTLETRCVALACRLYQASNCSIVVLTNSDRVDDAHKKIAEQDSFRKGGVFNYRPGLAVWKSVCRLFPKSQDEASCS
jgi:hypothetical protein